MKIGLIDVDGHHYPNLVLMKLTKWHRIRGDTVEFVQPLGAYDRVYKSKVFTYTPDIPFLFNADEVVTGGTGYHDFSNLLPEIEHIEPDYSLYPSFSSAYGFLTRGCPNCCSWCVVPRKEGKIRAHADITEFLSDRKEAVLLDNNVLASPFGLSQIEKIIKLKVKIDFNQGLDCRQMVKNPDIVKLLSKVRWIKFIRIACDSSEMMPWIAKAVPLMLENGIKPYRIFCYVLVNKDVEEAYQRIMFLRKLSVIPFAQPFRNFSETCEITPEQRKLALWVNYKPFFYSIPFKDFKL